MHHMTYKMKWLNSWDAQFLHQVIHGARKSDFCSIMVDETRDISNREQLVICLRWTDECPMPQEDYQIDRADACTIAAVVNDVLICLQMSLEVSVMMVAAQ